MDPKYYEAISRACLESDADSERRAARETVGHPECDGTWGPRLRLYRRMVRGNLRALLEARFPRTVARLAMHPDAPFEQAFESFLAERAVRSHYLRDVPGEFLEWALPRWADLGVSEELRDVARFELLEFAVSSAASSEKTSASELSLDRGVSFDGTVRIASFSHAVHEASAPVDERAGPPARPVTLLVHRDAECVVRFLELAPFSAALLLELLGGATLRDAFSRAAETARVSLTDELLADAARMLADLAERRVVLGGHPPAGRER